MRRLKHPLLLASLAAALAWIVVPPSDVDVDLDPDCRPASVTARTSEVITGKWFWRRQLAATIAERDRWLAIQSRSMFEESTVSALESRLSRLSEAEHEDTLRRFRQNRIGWTATCAAQIERRLAAD